MPVRCTTWGFTCGATHMKRGTSALSWLAKLPDTHNVACCWYTRADGFPCPQSEHASHNFPIPDSPAKYVPYSSPPVIGKPSLPVMGL
eukprot:360719-Chlamydomonas_euryale.AAC.6